MVKNSPEFACGQILYNIKMSQLNYFLQETPYSVHITIRKRFKKDSNLNSEVREVLEAPSVVENYVIKKELSDKCEALEKENKELKLRVKDNLIDIGKLEYDIEELEVEALLVFTENFQKINDKIC